MDPAYALFTHGADETKRAGELLAGLLEPGDVLALSGDLGAGKTCLVQGIASGLGVEEPVTSPTFNLLLVHPGRLTLYHFDLYRLEDALELDDLGFYEALETGGVSAIEWGDRFPGSLPADHLGIVIHLGGEDRRTIELAPAGPRSDALASAWHEACVTEGMVP